MLCCQSGIEEPKAPRNAAWLHVDFNFSAFSILPRTLLRGVNEDIDSNRAAHDRPCRQQGRSVTSGFD
jgi:hypothetical protein